MKKLCFLILCIFAISNLNAKEQVAVAEIKPSNFIDEMNGLENSFSQALLKSIENTESTNASKRKSSAPRSTQQALNIVDNDVDEEDTLQKDSELSKVKSDFTETKKLDNIVIKSIYKFAGVNYAVLKFKDANKQSAGGSEFSVNIEGRYKRGDYLLGHRIISINRRTKVIKLYRAINDDFAYIIYLSTNGSSVGKLTKIRKNIKNTKDKEGGSSSTRNRDTQSQSYDSVGATIDSIHTEDGKIVIDYIDSISSNNVKYNTKQNRYLKKHIFEFRGNFIDAYETKLELQNIDGIKVYQAKDNILRIEIWNNKSVMTNFKVNKRQIVINVDTSRNSMHDIKSVYTKKNTIIVKYRHKVSKKNIRLLKKKIRKRYSNTLTFRGKFDKASPTKLKLKNIDKIRISQYKKDILKISIMDRDELAITYKVSSKQIVINVAKLRPTYCVYTVLPSQHNIRNKPSAKSQVVNKLRRGDKISIIKRKGDWMHISTIYTKSNNNILDVKHENNWIKFLPKNLKPQSNKCIQE